MGEEVKIIAIEIIQGGLFQIDIEFQESKKRMRIFSQPEELLGMVGGAMKTNLDRWWSNYHEKREQN